MPLTAFIAKDGRRIPLNEVDIRYTVEQFDMPPADVAAVIRQASSRADVKPHQVTASQIGNGARQLYLEQTVDYAREPRREWAALTGTMKHAMLNVEYPGVSVEQRVTSKDDRFSARYDTFVPETGVLRDRKGVAFYKVLMVLKHGVEKEARDYVYQLNFTALLLCENGHDVKEMWLDFEPTGVGMQEKKELEAKFGITDARWIPISVPFLPESEVRDAYMRLSGEKLKALNTGTVPPMCDSKLTWNGKKCSQGPDGSAWCPVARECAAIAEQRGEVHPMNKKATAA